MDTAYTWLCTDASGEPMGDLPPPGGSFPTQADAEAWLSTEWESLAEVGVTAVTLRLDDEDVYGPMSLSPGV